MVNKDYYINQSLGCSASSRWRHGWQQCVEQRHAVRGHTMWHPPCRERRPSDTATAASHSCDAGLPWWRAGEDAQELGRWWCPSVSILHHHVLPTAALTPDTVNTAIVLTRPQIKTDIYLQIKQLTQHSILIFLTAFLGITLNNATDYRANRLTLNLTLVPVRYSVSPLVCYLMAY